MKARVRVAIALAGAVSFALAATSTRAAEAASSVEPKPSAEVTPAEHLIFEVDHLHEVPAQTELDYAMVAAGEKAEPPDVVRVLVASQGNAKGDAKVSDRGGEHPVPTSGLPCNPVVIYFLERDIAEMEALTGGQRRYFQKRVRLALAEGPKIVSATEHIGGKAVAVRQIVIQPYLHDPNAERFTRYVGKRYTFELADALPGQIALIRTEVPGPNDDFVHPVKTETLSFQAAVRKLPTPGGPTPTKPGDAPRASR
jgi:hypothetical protein